MQNKFGQMTEEQSSGGVGELGFIVGSLINRIQTVTLVQVKAVNATGVAPVGTVDVQPMVAQLDGEGKAHAHGVIHNIPYFRLQGGSNAIVIDPQVGDIGMCGFCSRDISSVKANKAPSTPQSLRKFDYADGLYFGGFLNGVPEQYIFFKDSGIDVVATGEVYIKGSKIKLDAPVETTNSLKVETTITAGGDITDNAKSGGKSMSSMRQSHNNHTHNGGPAPDVKV
ncbi:Gp138 family membrane-puncturing spike protein [Glaesserella parasuis]|uniref:Gp138 family membrane-puncturing spike protein n=1 Tax=Glaesserella parasuis TaxID=738 RepID=UPI0004A14336|nr:Gp138 family membrane-puncturing spike protein [Glaesserella parasuis]KDD79083.1 phage baseplate assembly protein [Glaesserella parasuis ST4-2]KDD80956.1 phage baseplate assembly protein [Glaesserella parasuis ST4-1]MDG6274408.1 Gp138 family membrane-puncturing spike protein [Glaesserella parasuis]MDG6278595.1 Gp138 family membrane-puncturing spike protein [Glaesserella parasuis]MDG6299456.1 Gp138 family membrane-puncturing spike protein [Glaesserella parasuis]